MMIRVVHIAAFLLGSFTLVGCSKSPEQAKKEFETASQDFFYYAETEGSRDQVAAAYSQMSTASPVLAQNVKGDYLQYVEILELIGRFEKFNTESDGKIAPEAEWHDIRDPLTSLLGASLIIEEGTGSQKGRKVLSYQNVDLLKKKGREVVTEIRRKLAEAK